MSTTTMSRTEAYDAIKKNNLQAECLKKFGKNFTRCSTADLIHLIDSKLTAEPAAPKIEPVAALVAPTTPSAPVEPVAFVYTQAMKTIKRIVDILYQECGIEEQDDVDEILSILAKENASVSAQTDDFKSSSDFPYSNDELYDMFKDMPR